MTDDALITLDEAAKLIPGCDAASLKRHIRAGRLKAYKPGKAYLTTRSAVRELIEATVVRRAEPRLVDPAVEHRRTIEAAARIGLTATDMANMALDRALQISRDRRERQEQKDRSARQAERERIKRERALEKKR